MNIEQLEDRVRKIKLWSCHEQKTTFLEGLNFCRMLIRVFVYNTRSLIGYRELFFLKRHPELIPEEWWGKRVYAFNPRSLKRYELGFANVFCLNLLNESDGPKIHTHAVVSTWFTIKDFVGYVEED